MTALPLDGATEWLDTRPDLHGRVVVVNFWTLTCINWIRQAPWIRAWARAYRDDGLVVVGVHTPEFSFEHDPALVRRAVRDRGLKHPIVIDNDSAIWTAFDNNYWPALYFADRDGVIRDFHIGEGPYAEPERTLQRLLGVDREPVTVAASGIEAPADWDHLRTPETYLVDGTRAAGTYLPFNRWGTAGEWSIGREKSVVDEPGGSLACHFRARDAHLVLSPGDRAEIPFQVFLDGEPPGAHHGTDVDEDGRGVLREGRLYHLIRQADGVREVTVEIAFLDAGAEAYAFSFG
ncbi:redoxin domain-containing protein [Paractinoplanes globisporus]|uniref:Redoxin domain-containing protein n=1 Tax=Paractinoplanes globisporus TaxID=113565 RepID=A0ABW6WI61_9ACTN|nr:redoxin domain-containing protein [Actinoplanes globisporus]